MVAAAGLADSVGQFVAQSQLRRIAVGAPFPRLCRLQTTDETADSVGCLGDEGMRMQDGLVHEVDPRSLSITRNITAIARTSATKFYADEHIV